MPVSATSGREPDRSRADGSTPEGPEPEGSAQERPEPEGAEPEDPDPDDAELVRRASGGEHRAWEIIVDRHLPLVNGIARSYRLSAPDREDAVQTVWLSLNQHLPRLRSPDRLRAWLRRVTRDTCARQRRRALRQHPVDPRLLADLPLTAVPSPEAEYLDKERHEELHSAIRRLPDPRDRLAVQHYLDQTPAPPGLHGTDGPRAASNHRRRIVRALRRIMKGPQQ